MSISPFPIGFPLEVIECRIGCGACCIFAEIHESFQGQPNGKKSGERCSNLSDENTCLIYEDRPEACRNFLPRRIVCGDTNEEAFKIQEAMINA